MWRLRQEDSNFEAYLGCIQSKTISHKQQNVEHSAHACLSIPCPVYLASAWTFVEWRSCCSATLLFKASTSCRSAAECSISPSRRFRSDLEKRAPQFRGYSPSPLHRCPRARTNHNAVPAHVNGCWQTASLSLVTALSPRAVTCSQTRGPCSCDSLDQGETRSSADAREAL